MAQTDALAAPATLSATHVRDAMSVRRSMNLFVVALLPPTAMALYNTGRQANLAMEQLGVAAAPGWRGRLIELFGTGYGVADPWAAIVHGAVYFVPALVAVVVAAAFWIRLFAAARGRRAEPGAFAIALVVTLMLPPTIPLWLAPLGMSFGIVVGREVFGGFGRNVLNPAVAALALLHVAYPARMMAGYVWVPVEGYVDAMPLALAQRGELAALEAAGVTWMDAFLGSVPGGFGETSVLAILVGAAVLLWTGLASWRVIAGIVLGAVATVLVFGAGTDASTSILGLPWAWHLVLGTFACGAVYLATDPVTSATTDTGRWIYGLLIGGLAIVIRVAGPAHADGMVFAILLGNIFAPTIDYAVMWANIRRRARRHVQ